MRSEENEIGLPKAQQLTQQQVDDWQAGIRTLFDGACRAAALSREDLWPQVAKKLLAKGALYDDVDWSRQICLREVDADPVQASRVSMRYLNETPLIDSINEVLADLS